MTHYLDKHHNLDDSSLISVVDELPLWSAPFGLELLKIIKIRKNITVLDIGFGLGFPILEIAMRLGKSCKVYGIDPWKAAIERTSYKIKHYGITNVELIEGVAENITLETNSIDLLVSNNGINNVQDLSKTLSECNRVAKKGAQFVITVNLPDSMIEFYTVFEKVLIENGFKELIPDLKAHIYKKRIPLETHRKLLDENGFKVLKAKESEFSFRFNDAESMFSHFLISLAFLDSWKEIVPETHRKEIFLEIEKQIDEIAEANSGFTLTIPFVTFDCLKL
jgi:ubiquinone/menaquinone biosynthesis C-methylase UbiE